MILPVTRGACAFFFYSDGQQVGKLLVYKLVIKILETVVHMQE